MRRVQTMMIAKSLIRGLDENYIEYIKDKLRRLLIFREADLQVWTYYWLVTSYEQYLGKKYWIFNQARFQDSPSIPDLVFMHDQERIAAIELKNQLIRRIPLYDILDDTRKCLEYLNSYKVGIQIVVHEFNAADEIKLKSGISDIREESGDLASRFHHTLLSVRELYDSLEDYNRWRQALSHAEGLFKSTML